VCEKGGVEVSCATSGRHERTQNGQTIVRTYVRNEDGTYTVKDLLQGDDELAVFRNQVSQLVDAWYVLLGAVATFSGAIAGGGFTCYATLPTGSGAVAGCGGAAAAIIATGIYYAWAQSNYNDIRAATYQSFYSLSEPSRKRRCRETITSVSCVG
jgi:hypothetical protein